MTVLNCIYRWYWCVAFFWINDACGQDWSLDLHQSRIIGLGEQWHGDEKFIEMRCNLLKEFSGWDSSAVMIMENSFNALAVQFLRHSDPKTIVDRALQQFWNHPEIIQMMDQVVDPKRCRLFGCDPLEDCRFTDWSAFMLERGWFPNHHQVVHQLDALIDPFIGPDALQNRMSSAQYDSAFRAITILKTHLVTGDEDERAWALHMLQNRTWLVEFLHRPYDRHIVTFRDSVMYENVKFILTRCKPADKIFLWAANLHVSRSVGGHSMFLGEFLHRDFGAAYAPVLCEYSKLRRGKRILLQHQKYRLKKKNRGLVMTTSRRKALVYKSPC